MKKYLFIVFFALILFFAPRVNALSVSGNATIGRSAVMDTSLNYYYTDWKSLTSNSLNIVPIPYSGGDYYQMGSEYAIAITLNGETSFSGSVRIPVASNTIYNYQLMNGLNENDIKIGIHQNFSNYNITPSNWSLNWSCMTYPHLGVAHNVCYYDYDFSFTLPEALTGSYNLNFAMLNTTASRSSYYYSGYDSNGNAIEFPVSASNTDYASVAPIVNLRGSGGSSSSDDNSDIIDSITDSTEELKQTIQESYENLVKSQEVCSSRTITFSDVFVSNKYLNDSGELQTSASGTGVTDYLPITSSSVITLMTSSNPDGKICFYNSSKINISCSSPSGKSNGFVFSIPSNTSYVRFTIASSNKPNYDFYTCYNGNQALYDELHDSSIDTHSANSFFESMDFYEDATLSSVITAPLDFINSLDDGCTPVVLTYRGQSITLPCGDTIFWNRDDVSTFRAFWNALFGGLILYRLVRRLFLVVNDAMNPEKDTIGGLDL